MELPSEFNLQYDKDEINLACERIGVDISVWAKEVRAQTSKDVIAIPVLRGGVFFFADVVREVSCSLEVAPVRTWAYEQTLNQPKLKDEVQIDQSGVDPEGRSVLFLDDICDSGKTLTALKERFLTLGANEVRSAVLIKRELSDETFNPDYVGFNYNGPEWFVGYGMEDNERWRNLSSIYIIEGTGGHTDVG